MTWMMTAMTIIVNITKCLYEALFILHKKIARASYAYWPSPVGIIYFAVLLVKRAIPSIEQNVVFNQHLPNHINLKTAYLRETYHFVLKSSFTHQ